MAKPKLETLPIELRAQILLELPDLQSLDATARSSTALYQAYRLVRQEAPPKVLQMNYDGLVDISEAIAAVRSRNLCCGKPSDHEGIIALLDDRRRNKEIRCLGKRSGATQRLPDQPADLNEVRDLLRLHEIATWLLDDYSQNAACPFWADETKWRTEILPLRFSTVEKRRYFRAFYRLQTYCNILDNGEHPVDSPDHGPNRRNVSLYKDKIEWMYLFFGPFTPWEYEEFGCLWKHFYNRLAERYYEVANDLLQYGEVEVAELPENLQILPSAAYEFNSRSLRLSEVTVRENLASLGPTFLFKFLQEKSYINRRNIVLANADPLCEPYPEAVRYSLSDSLLLLDPADRFNLGVDREGLQALLSTLPEIGQPNLSWVKTWLEQMEEDEPLYEEIFVTGVNGRRWAWAYALWDDDRLREWEAKWGAPLRDFGV